MVRNFQLSIRPSSFGSLLDFLAAIRSSRPENSTPFKIKTSRSLWLVASSRPYEPVTYTQTPPCWLSLALSIVDCKVFRRSVENSRRLLMMLRSDWGGVSLYMGRDCAVFVRTVFQVNRFEKISACSIASSKALCVCGLRPLSHRGRELWPERLMGTRALVAYIVLMSSARENPNGDSPMYRIKYQ